MQPGGRGSGLRRRIRGSLRRRHTHEGIGQGDTKDLLVSQTYRASAFPVSVRFRPPDAYWGGVQYRNGGFGFIQLSHHRTGSVPLHGVGYITLEAAVGRAPSVATAIARLHDTPHILATPIKTTRIAANVAKEFDATIVGVDGPGTGGGISLAPFLTNPHCGFCGNGEPTTETRDVKFAGKGQLFHIIVLGVHSKTVVIYVESGFADQPRYPPTKTFPTFLPYARPMLLALTFGR